MIKIQRFLLEHDRYNESSEIFYWQSLGMQALPLELSIRKDISYEDTSDFLDACGGQIKSYPEVLIRDLKRRSR
jgi:hypothetical protein